MGNFLIQIEACGGHGDDREALQGERINNPDTGVDALGAQCVALVSSKASVVAATLTHWPDGTPIIDNILSGLREAGDFKRQWVDEPLLQFFSYHHLTREDMKAVSKTFCRMAFEMCARLPRNAERTVMLRKLLEAKDCAVRALLVK